MSTTNGTRSLRRAVLAALAALAPVLAAADVFDLQTPSDDTTATENELIHRTEQRHDLAVRPGPVADVDWYRIVARPYSSYEVVVDETSGDVGPTLVLDRLSSDGVSLQQTSSGVSSIGYNRTLRWENTTASPATHFIRVRSGACTTTCNATAVYRIRSFETTGFIPRFYDHGTIRTVFVVQNPTNATVSGRLYYWHGHDATLLATDPFTLPARGMVAIQPNPALVAPCGPDAQGCTGHVTVGSNAGYGELRAKAAQIDGDPTRNESWDHEMVPVP
jgi:hypothetical protein